MIKEAPMEMLGFDAIASGGFDFELPTVEIAPVTANPVLVEPQKLTKSTFRPPTSFGISFQEKLAKRMGSVKVDMSKREWLVNEIETHQTSITRLAEVAAYAAKRQQENCATDGHGNKLTSSFSATGEMSFSSSPLRSLTEVKHNHKAGSHEHCDQCGGDLENGRCSKGHSSGAAA